MLLRIQVSNASGQHPKLIVAESRQIGFEPEFIAENGQRSEVVIAIQHRLLTMARVLMERPVQGNA